MSATHRTKGGRGGSGRRIWIVDGHNVIFAFRELRELQVSGRGDEARGALEEKLRRFACARNEPVLLVFDGQGLQPAPGGSGNPLLQVAYAGPSDGTADGRVIREARSRSGKGQHVTVVTDDRRTLAVELPKRVLHLRVQEFWEKHISPPGDPEEKRVEGDFSDIEREMEERAATTRQELSGRGCAPKKPAAAPPDPKEEMLRRKKERGRLRQERRLKRRPG
jgi:hypothetical protein